MQARWCRRRYRRRSVTQIQSPTSTAASRRARVALGACHGAPWCPLQCAYARALKLPTKENYEHDGCYIQLYSSCDVKCGPHAKVGKPALWSGFPIFVPEIIRLSCLQSQCQIYLRYIYYICLTKLVLVFIILESHFDCYKNETRMYHFLTHFLTKFGKLRPLCKPEQAQIRT